MLVGKSLSRKPPPPALSCRKENMKNINIEIETKKIDIDIVSKIEVNGVCYPLHRYNLRLVNEYLATKDPKVLEKLSVVSLEI